LAAAPVARIIADDPIATNSEAAKRSLGDVALRFEERACLGSVFRVICLPFNR
jgi:hypothetical protein